eukprot:4787320-Prymnesium_polylepis.2
MKYPAGKSQRKMASRWTRQLKSPAPILPRGASPSASLRKMTFSPSFEAATPGALAFFAAAHEMP